ncbi:hypothetical protein BLNAU_11926 [Blattamonas nauphoetae]|uniref:VWFA domain-containing protein n=1 Tax=Blattamonas nauphoetae TaxID=2049346 RepID=A0ABQ9XS18_9EUKA|nr:hypothetical protein BLNAU_11926 [Blattamonas nauphoetae]
MPPSSKSGKSQDSYISATFHAPRLKTDQFERLPIDLIVAVDFSSSITKFEQVLICLEKVITELEDDDRFGLILFSGKIEVLVPLSQMNLHSKKDALERVLTYKKKPQGATDILKAISTAIEMLNEIPIVSIEEQRQPCIWVFSDGIDDNAHRQTVIRENERSEIVDDTVLSLLKRTWHTNMMTRLLEEAEERRIYRAPLTLPKYRMISAFLHSDLETIMTLFSSEWMNCLQNQVCNVKKRFTIDFATLKQLVCFSSISYFASHQQIHFSWPPTSSSPTPTS